MTIGRCCRWKCYLHRLVRYVDYDSELQDAQTAVNDASSALTDEIFTATQLGYATTVSH
jgi:hypothetical protein